MLFPQSKSLLQNTELILSPLLTFWTPQSYSEGLVCVLILSLDGPVLDC